jgi:hypothetical protein
MRVYLPATPAILADLARSGEIGPAPVRGYAVTDAVREAYDDSDEEELEYLATGQAAEDSFRLAVAATPGLVPGLAPGPASEVAPGAAPGSVRRVVIVAELSGARVEEVGDPLGAVVLAQAVPLSAVAAFHLDDPDFTLDPGDPEGAADQELLWYAAQELGDLVEP